MQNPHFDIHADWLPEQNILAPDARIAHISIGVNGVSLSKNTNIFDNSHPDFFTAAPYPMALWFLDNWWRLCFEPTPDMPTTDWRMSHMLSAAGYGYSWPTIGFQSDLQNITITSIPTLDTGASSARFENASTYTVPRTTFATSILSFIEDCMHHAADAELEAIYEAITREQADAEVTLFRTIEAMLGFDAGFAPEERVINLVRTAQKYDTQTVRELSWFLYDHPELEEEMQAVRNGTSGCKVDISSLRTDTLQVDGTAQPWDEGYSLARQVRHQWNLNGPIANATLCECMAVQQRELEHSDRDDVVGLGARTDDAVFSLKFAKRSRTATRFMFARGLCDAILSKKGDSDFLMMTPSKTAKQKMQRAFAAEFLCPIDDIVQETDNLSDTDAIDYVAEKYNVNARLVESQLSNHGFGQMPSEKNIWFPITVFERECCA